jgi:hypothetical protein
MITFNIFASASEKNLSNYFRDIDAASDRNIILPNAQTLKQGEVTINNYFVIINGLSVGITDNFQLTLTAQPFKGAMIFQPLYFLSGKYKLITSSKYIFSIQLSEIYSYSYTDSSDEPQRYFSTLTSFLFDYFLSNRFFISFNLSLFPINHFTGKDSILNLSTNLTFLIFKNVKFLLESNSGIMEDDKEISFYPLIVDLGVRFFGENFAFDISIFKNLMKKELFPFFSVNIKF